VVAGAAAAAAAAAAADPWAPVAVAAERGYTLQLQGF